MATFPPRLQGMLQVVTAMLPQCDRLCLYMNGYTQPPPGLPVSDKLEIVLAGPGQPRPDLGSQGKLWWLGKYSGYYLTVDDDMVYPAGYVRRMVEAVQHYEDKAIVCAHGSIYKVQADGTPVLQGGFLQDQRILFAFDQEVRADRVVHGPGNACMACNPEALGMTAADVIQGPLHSGDDPDIAVWAQRHGTPIIRVATPQRWITSIPGMGMREPMHRRQASRVLVNAKLRQIPQWRLMQEGVALTPQPALPAAVVRARAVGRVTNHGARTYIPWAPAPGKVMAVGKSAIPKLPVARPLVRRVPVPPVKPGFAIPAEQLAPLTSPIICAMATFPPRREGMVQAVRTLLPQCDRFYLYMNGYTEIPEELPVSDKLHVILAGPGSDYPDRGSQGKLYWAGLDDGYYMTVDDDIIYPADYTLRMAHGVERYGRNAIITVHGTTWALQPDNTFYPDINTLWDKLAGSYPYYAEFNSDNAVHVAGLGCTAFCPRQLGITRSVCTGPLHSGDDPDVAVWAQDNNVPVIRIASPAGWLQMNGTIWQRGAMCRSMQCRRLSDAKFRLVKYWHKQPLPTIVPGH